MHCWGYCTRQSAVIAKCVYCAVIIKLFDYITDDDYYMWFATVGLDENISYKVPTSTEIVSDLTNNIKASNV